MKRKIYALILSVAMVMSMSFCNVAFASSEDWDFSGVTAEIDLDSSLVGDALVVMEEIINDFNELTGANLEAVENGGDHEVIMKTRMASNDMPDMFITHGWSRTRYNEFSYDLAGEPWVDKMADSAASLVTDANGKVCAYPLTEYATGMAYNETIMEENGIDIRSVHTWDDLEEVLQELKDAGVTPASMGGKDSVGFAALMEWASMFYTVDGAPYDGGEELLDGTFSFVDHPEIFELMAELYDKGFFNEDLFTTDFDTSALYIADETCAVMLAATPDYISLMKAENPDDEFAIMPIPAVEEDGIPAYFPAEGTCIAVSASSDCIDLCEAFLEYLSEPDNLSKYIDAAGALCGFSTITEYNSYAMNQYNDSLGYYDEITYQNLFDREYLPNGMYNYMCEAISLYNCPVGEAMDGVPAVVETFQQAFEEVYATAQDAEE